MIVKNTHMKIYICFILLSLFYGADERPSNDNAIYHPWSSSISYNTQSSVRAINSFERPNNPMLDRAFGYLLKGKAQAALTNYGRFVDWDYHPPGLWGNYTYLPSVDFVAGVPGESYSYNYTWVKDVDYDDCPDSS